MALILNIETATPTCSVVLALNGNKIAIREDFSGQSHARLLTTFVDECLNEAGYELNDLQAIAVSKGPGSFTGLRIGVASAKGFCYGLNIPLIGVNTLQSMASYFLLQHEVVEETWLCPMIDARRMEVYTAFFDVHSDFKIDTSAKIIVPGIFDSMLGSRKVIFFGDGMEKTRQILDNHLNASFYNGIFSSASGMISFSEKSYKNGQFEDVAYFEPYYLKDFFTVRQPVKPA